MTFYELKISEPLLRAITEMGFEKPMPVQEAVIPLQLESSQDLVALAQTGTGKTAAYGLPLLQRLTPTAQPQAIVLSPTMNIVIRLSLWNADRTNNAANSSTADLIYLISSRISF